MYQLQCVNTSSGRAIELDDKRSGSEWGSALRSKPQPKGERWIKVNTRQPGAFCQRNTAVSGQHWTPGAVFCRLSNTPATEHLMKWKSTADVGGFSADGE